MIGLSAVQWFPSAELSGLRTWAKTYSPPIGRGLYLQGPTSCVNGLRIVPKPFRASSEMLSLHAGEGPQQAIQRIGTCLTVFGQETNAT
jgi:hypothetical protein